MRVPQGGRDVYTYLLKTHSGLDNKRIGGVFDVSLGAVTQAVLWISEQMKTRRRLMKENGQILYSIFKVTPAVSKSKELYLYSPFNLTNFLHLII